VLQSFKYNAPLLGVLGAVLTPASYSQQGATVSFTLLRANGMTQLNVGANSQFINTNLVTMEVTTLLNCWTAAVSKANDLVSYLLRSLRRH
jgi:hypothetical protein